MEGKGRYRISTKNEIDSGLQEDVKEVSEFGVQINRAFGAGDTFVYIPFVIVFANRST